MYAPRDPQMRGREYMSVQEYLEAEETSVDQFGPGDDLVLESIDFRVSMAQLYRGVAVERPAHI